MTHFAEFLKKNELPHLQIIKASKSLETRRGSDRSLATSRAHKRREDKEKSYQDVGLEKPRSGRGLSHRQFQAALSDVPLPPKVRGKVVRAVNAVLTQRKQSPVSAVEVFGGVPPRKRNGTEG